MPTVLPNVHKGPNPVPFSRLMSLRQISPDTYESLVAAWSPPANRDIPNTRAFGGHVYAQSIWAASQTVAKGMVMHNVTGQFILPGGITTPFVYKVRRIRDGGTYCLRGVDVYQDTDLAENGETPCFVAIVSFKREENGKKTRVFGHQSTQADYIRKEYGTVLVKERVEEYAVNPAADCLWWDIESGSEKWQHVGRMFPGLEMRKVDMKQYNGVVEEGDSAGTRHWRQLTFYRLIKDENDPKELDMNLAAAAHAYASDRNSMYLIQRASGLDGTDCAMGSLSHTVIFHGIAKDLTMVDEKGQPKWFVQESWVDHAGDGRGGPGSRLWDYEEGKVIASTLQDGMIRALPRKQEDSKGGKSKL